jgi:transcription antitermination factor NusG
VEISTERKWFVVRTMAQMDNRVRDGLHDIGAETYLPILVEERIRRNKRVEWPQRPLAGYVFAGIIGGSPMALGHCEGAIEVLTLDADHVTGCNEERREALAATRQKIKLRGLETLNRLRYSTNQDQSLAVLALAV